VIIDSGDGSGNTTAPADDPGWAHVGSLNGYSAVYIRNGWVLSAYHAGLGTVNLGGVDYSFVSGSGNRLSNGDATLPDLRVFAITPDPGLPELPIRSDPAPLPNDVILIGHGWDRGPATDSDDPLIWAPPPPPPIPAIPGWFTGGVKTKRWGENVVGGAWPGGNPNDTVAFYTAFDYPSDPSHQAHEAQAVGGDSGGAVFAKQGGTWELAGIMIVNGLYEGHINNSVLRDEWTGAADLRFYRQEILDLTAVPEPSGSSMLGAGVTLLALMQRWRERTR
jgi:hypothetical protein